MTDACQMQLKACTFLDIKVREQTESSIARRAPGIKAQALRYNKLVESVCRDPIALTTQFVLPQQVNIAELYNPNANTFMWAANTLAPTTGAEPYVTNDDVRRGIAAVHMQDRAEEELHRLRQELNILGDWMTSELYKLRTAIELCKGESRVHKAK